MSKISNDQISRNLNLNLNVKKDDNKSTSSFSTLFNNFNFKSFVGYGRYGIVIEVSPKLRNCNYEQTNCSYCLKIVKCEFNDEEYKIKEKSENILDKNNKNNKESINKLSLPDFEKSIQKMDCYQKINKIDHDSFSERVNNNRIKKIFEEFLKELFNNNVKIDEGSDRGDLYKIEKLDYFLNSSIYICEWSDALKEIKKLGKIGKCKPKNVIRLYPPWIEMIDDYKGRKKRLLDSGEGKGRTIESTYKTGFVFFVFEKYEDDLKNFLNEKSSRLNLNDRLTIFWGLINGLKEIHSSEVCHHDIKADNILISYHENQSTNEITINGIYYADLGINSLMVADNKMESGEERAPTPEESKQIDVFKVTYLVIRLLFSHIFPVSQWKFDLKKCIFSFRGEGKMLIDDWIKRKNDEIIGKRKKIEKDIEDMEELLKEDNTWGEIKLKIKELSKKLEKDEIKITCPLFIGKWLKGKYDVNKMIKDIKGIEIKKNDIFSSFLRHCMYECDIRENFVYYDREIELLKDSMRKLNEKVSLAFSNMNVLKSFVYENEPIPYEKDICFVCNKFSTKRCSRCKKMTYCSSECQKNDWERHKKKCVLIKQ